MITRNTPLAPPSSPLPYGSSRSQQVQVMLSPVPAFAGDGAKVKKYLQVSSDFLFDVNFILVHFFTFNFVQTYYFFVRL